ALGGNRSVDGNVAQGTYPVKGPVPYGTRLTAVCSAAIAIGEPRRVSGRALVGNRRMDGKVSQGTYPVKGPVPYGTRLMGAAG
ncbi:MAG: hypothetical protein RIK87_09665, partial [Fuerstiella sp.]